MQQNNMPSKWCILRTPENAEEVNGFLNKVFGIKGFVSSVTLYIHFDPEFFQMGYDHVRQGYTEITIDQLREIAGVGLVYEDQLPEMSDAEYSEWYSKSKIVDGVRMGPKVEHPLTETQCRFVEWVAYGINAAYVGINGSWNIQNEGDGEWNPFVENTQELYQYWLTNIHNK